MFVGVSKNLGNGFRIGVGTKLGGGGKLSAKELNTIEFQEFMQKVQDDINNALLIFIEANGHSYKELVKSKADLDEVFKDNSNYQEFMSIFYQTKKDIEKILYIGDSGVVAKRAITESVFTLKEFMDNKYPNFTIKEKIKQPMNKFLKWFLIILGLIIISNIIAINNSKKMDEQSKQSSQSLSK